MDLHSFAEDRKTVDAVVRNFTIIGEATKHIPEQVINENPQIAWREMGDMRNIVVHEYFGVAATSSQAVKDKSKRQGSHLKC